MDHFKKAQVIMLPTDKSKLHLSVGGKLTDNHCLPEGTNSWKPQHLYITSDDKIKTDDWCYDKRDGSIFKIKLPLDEGNYDVIFKIIATTDADLFKLEECPVRGATSSVKYSLPKPSQDFMRKYIAAYNKRDIITEVIVEYESEFTGKEYVDDQDAYGYDKFEKRLKVHTATNTVHIKKLQESWNREGIKALLLAFGTQATTKQISLGHIPSEFVADELEIINWLKENV